MRPFHKAIFIALSLACLGNSLHLHEASESYVSYLKQNQNQMKSKLDSLAGKIDQNYQTVSKQNSIDKKIDLLEAYLKQQRLLLSQISLQTANQQLNSSEWVCPVISDPRKKQINDNIAIIDQDLKDIDKILQPLDDFKTGPGIDNAKEQIKDAEKTNDLLRDALNSNGQEIQPPKVSPDTKTNLNAPNWVLDGKKIDDLNNQYKKSAESGALQICDINAPFYSSKQNKCIQCHENKQYFSLRTSECLVCYNFDPKQHRCKDNEGEKTNFVAAQDKLIVPEGKNITEYKEKEPSSKIACPDNAPFYTGSQCIQCQKYFDLQSLQCKKCEGQNYYDLKTHTCKMQQITVTNLDAGKNGLIIPDDKTLADLVNQNKKLEDEKKVNTCPIEKPYFNDFECISCANGTLFSLIQKSCGTCKQGTFYNKETNHCQSKLFYTNIADPNWSSTKKYPQIEKQLIQKSKDPLFEKCTIEKPFSTGKQCIQCSNGEHFDYDKKQCAKCYNGQIFNKNLHSCSFAQNNYQTNPQKADNLIYEGHPKNEWMYIYYKNIEKNQGMTDCPQDKPYYDGQTCIICPEEKSYFNLESKLCQKCSQGTKYEKDHHECMTTSGNIASQSPTLEKMAAGIFA